MSDFVDVYFNLRARVWSLRSRSSGRVERHTRVAVFPQGARFVVQAKGRAQVLRTRSKTVHAFVRGLCTTPDADAHPDISGMVPVSYNPYTADHFVRRDTGARIDMATRVVMVARPGAPPEVWAQPA